jgi:flagellar motility protein MotE (MotC chaperone)
LNQGYDNFFKQAKKVRSPQSRTDSQISPLAEIDQHFAFRTDKARAQPKTSTAQAQSQKTMGHKLSPEQKLKIKFLERKRLLKKQSQLKSRLPIFAIACILSAVVCIGLGYYYSNRVVYLLKHVEINMNSALAADVAAPVKADPKSEKSADPATSNAEKKSQTDVSKNKNEVPDLRNMSKEELSYFGHLVDRKKELDQREAELNKLDEELQKQRVELEDKIHKLEKMRTEISGILKDRVEVDQEKVQKLVQFYSSMKAQQAAKVIESLNEDLAVEVLDKMKKKSAAEIMNSLDPKKAKKLSEILAGYRKPASEDESKR